MEPFRTRIEPTIEPVLPKVEIKEVGEKQNPNDNPLKDSDLKPINNLEVWEGENKKKFVNEYFNTHNIYHEFVWKMPISEIDKFVRHEMESMGQEKTTINYQDILKNIESQIGSEKLELSKRLNKIVGYIRAINKLYKARELKEKYLISSMPSQNL
jgi:hypothetical protein